MIAHPEVERHPHWIRSDDKEPASSQAARRPLSILRPGIAFFRMQLAAFPDLRMDVEDVVANGDKVVARVRLTGTNRGELMGMPATGKRVDVQLYDQFRFGDDGLVREHWGVLDALAMMQQLGVVPVDPPA